MTDIGRRVAAARGFLPHRAATDWQAKENLYGAPGESSPRSALQADWGRQYSASLNREAIHHPVPVHQAWREEARARPALRHSRQLAGREPGDPASAGLLSQLADPEHPADLKTLLWGVAVTPRGRDEPGVVRLAPLARTAECRQSGRFIPMTTMPRLSARASVFCGSTMNVLPASMHRTLAPWRARFSIV